MDLVFTASFVSKEKKSHVIRRGGGHVILFCANTRILIVNSKILTSNKEILSDYFKTLVAKLKILKAKQRT